MHRNCLSLAVVLAACCVGSAQEESAAEIVAARNSEAAALANAGRLEEALVAAEEALSLARSWLPDGHPQRLTALHNLGSLYARAGRLGEAEPLLERCIAGRRSTLGTGDPATLNSIRHLGDLYVAQGRLLEAEPLLRQCFEATEQRLGLENRETLSRLDSYALVLDALGRFEEAAARLQTCVEVSIRLGSAAHRHSLIYLYNLADIRIGQGRYAEAESLATQTLAIKRQVQGPHDVDTLASQFQLGSILRQRAKYARAEELLLACHQSQSAQLTELDPATLRTLNELAMLYDDLGHYRQAQELHQRCFQARASVLGLSGETLASLHNLAGVCETLGQYATAEGYYRLAIESGARAYGLELQDPLAWLGQLAWLSAAFRPYEHWARFFDAALSFGRRVLHIDYLPALNTIEALAGLYYAQGRYRADAALQAFCLRVRSRLVGPKNPRTLFCARNLAASLQAQGRYDEAEPLFRRYLTSQLEVHGEQHPETCVAKADLAGLYQSQARLEEALPLSRASNETLRAVLGEDHPRTIASHSGLAGILSEQGQYEAALELYARALATSRRVLGDAHRTTLALMGELGGQHLLLGEPTAAESLLVQCFEGQRRTLGETHPSTLTALHNLAVLNDDLSRPKKAIDQLRRCHRAEFDVLGAGHPTILRTAARLALILFEQGEEAEGLRRYQECLAQTRRSLGDEHPDTLIRMRLLGLMLCNAGQLVEGRGWQVQAARSSRRWLTSTLMGLARSQRASFLDRSGFAGQASWFVQRALDDASLVPIALEQTLWRKGRLLKAATEVDALARLQAAANPSIRDAVARLHASRRQYANLSMLPAEERDAQIAEVGRAIAELEQQLAASTRVYRPPLRDFEQAAEALGACLNAGEGLVELTAYTRDDGSWHYAAFVLRSGDDRFQLVPLGNAQAVDAAIARFRKLLLQAGPVSRVLYELAGRLYDELWAPLRLVLGDVGRVYVAPDGDFHLLPLGALRVPDGSWLAESVELRRVATSLDLLETARRTDLASALIVGDPAFDPDGGFPRLPGAAAEVDEVYALCTAAKLTQVSLLTEDRAHAQELQRLLATSAPGLLHVATHGFFSESAPSADHGLDPLVKTGLVLSPGPDHDDRLTALEVLGLPLDDTDLVVLSACNTGVGEIRKGDASGSLAEAFQRAGADQVVMSLWPIADAPTRTLMLRFYRRLLAGEEAGSALLQVQRELAASEDPRLAAPRTWAGLVLVGRRAP